MKIRTEAMVGFIGVFSIAILVWGINFLKGKNLFNKECEYHAKYSNINGLLPTSYVFINGMKVGKVNNIQPMDSQMKTFLVSFEIPAKIKLPSNSVAEVYSSDILGSKAMRIIVGNASTMLSNNDTMISKNSGDMFDEVKKMFNPYSSKLENIVNNIDGITASLNLILNKDNQQEFASILQKTNTAASNLAELSAEINGITNNEKEKIHAIVDNIKNLSETLDENDENLSLIINNFAKISDTLASINISNIMTDINTSLEALSTTLNKINKGNGNLGLLINDDKLYYNLEKSTKSLDSLINDIKANPKRYINVSVF
ncbi:MAG: MCE family protein [Bacteroidales bacterium]|nr:MCE family protein [Bacteroidales bacterium]